MGAVVLADNLVTRAELDSDGSSLMLCSFSRIMCSGEEKTFHKVSLSTESSCRWFPWDPKENERGKDKINCLLNLFL